MDAVAVVIDVTEGGDPALTRAMIDTCSASVTEGVCTISGTRAAGASPAHAIVTWQKDDLVADIALVDGAGAHKSAQSIPFHPEDPPIERWRSVGLVIATLVGDAHRALQAVPREPQRPAAPPRPTPPPAPSGPRHSLVFERFSTDLGVMVGNGLDGGPPRAGPFLRGAILIPKTPCFPTLSAAFALVPSNGAGVSARWVTLGAGLGVRAGLLDRTLALEARIEGLADWMGASATDTSGHSDTGGRWQPGARAGIAAAWMFTSHVGLTAGIDGDLVRSGTVVHVHGQALGRAAPEHIQGLIGARLGWL